MIYNIDMFVKVKSMDEVCSASNSIVRTADKECITTLDKLTLYKYHENEDQHHRVIVSGEELSVTREEYARLSKLMFKENEKEAHVFHVVNSGVEKVEIWGKRDLELLEGLEV